MALTNLLLGILGLIAILGPFGTDVYLPALPQMAAAMHTTPSGIQLNLTAFSFGMAAGQFLWGPTSDRFGRRPMLIVGPLLMAAGCAASALSTQLPILLAANVAIGMAACVGMVCGRAMISDLATDRNAARGFALMGLVTGLGPVIGPIAGAAVLTFSDWRGIYWFLAIFAAGCAVLALTTVKESLVPEKRHSGGFMALVRASGGIITNRNYLLHAIILCAGFTMLYSYISASPFILEKLFGLSPAMYTVVFAVNGIGMTITGSIGAAIMHRFGPTKQVALGVAMQVFAAALMLVAVLSQNFSPNRTPNLTLVLISFLLVPTSLSFIFGPGTALGLRQVRHLAGTAIAIQGAAQFIIAGLIVTLVGIAGERAIWPLATVFGVLCLVSVGAFVLKRKNDQMHFADDRA